MAIEIIFHYFHGRGIGEPVRLLLSVGGVEFTDKRYTIEQFSQMDELKARLPFRQIPALEIDGVLIGQTDSICRLAANLAQLYPSDPKEAARTDMIVVHQAEIQSAIAKMTYDGVPGAPGTKQVPKAERDARIDAWLDNQLPERLSCLEQLVTDSHMVGGRLTWADICVFNRLNHLIDIRETLFDQAFPKLKSVHQQVERLPEIQSWMRAHRQDYPRLKKAG